jgi:PTH1 family peptidyl-tRNA hydrolase
LRHNETLKRSSRERALVTTARFDDRRVVLAFPQTYMNESGISVGQLVRKYKVDDPSRVVIVHDELDLEVGRLQVKEGGGLAGHNGLRSVKNHLHSDAFVRVRLGVGRPPGKKQGADHVLKRPGRGEREELAVLIEEAADAVQVIVAEGVAVAMNRFNRK